MRSLIVDDEESARARLTRMLGSHPEIVIAGEARDGLEAVEKIEELKPELVFLDIELPGLTGFEVLQALRGTTSMPLVIFQSRQATARRRGSSSEPRSARCTASARASSARTFTCWA